MISSLIFGFFLAPNNFGILEFRDLRSYRSEGEGTQLLYSDDSHIISVELISGCLYIEVDLTRAENYFLDFLWGNKVLILILNDSSESDTFSELLNGGVCSSVLKEFLR